MAEPELRAHLAELGASDVDTESLDDSGLIGLAGDLQLAAGFTLDLEGLADETGCTADEVRSIYGMLGLRADDLGGFGDADVATISLITGDTTGIVDEIGTPLMRVTGTLLARLAEATVAAYVQDVELRADDVNDLIEMAKQNTLASALALALGDQLPAIFRHHMWTAVHRQREAQVSVDSPEIVHVAVGFVDLVGFTSLSRSLPPAELIATIEDFERRAFEAATSHGGRIVKSIGDEVMISAADPATVAHIALLLIESIGGQHSVAPRGGVSAGDVLFRLGDYYGPVVNLASRLAEEAVPGEVLTDQFSLQSPGLVVLPAGRRTLKGFDAPVAVWTIESDPVV